MTLTVRPLTALALVFVAALVAAPAAAQDAAAAPPAPAAPAAPVVESTATQEPVVALPEGVIATVNGEPIAESEWLTTMKRFHGASVLDVMIRHKIVHQQAARRGITMTDDEVQALVDKAAGSAGGIENLTAELADNGETIQDYREVLKTEALLRKMVEDTVTVTDEEVRKVYLEQHGRKAQVQAMVVSTQSEAEQTVAKARSGADFGMLAFAGSVDPYTARSYGHLPVPITEGFFPKPIGNLVITEPIAETIFTMKPGQVTDPIQGYEQKFYIFKVLEVAPALEVKFDVVKEQVRAQAMEYRIGREEQVLLEKLLESADIRTDIVQ
jgi:foldase protein PrsA